MLTATFARLASWAGIAVALADPHNAIPTEVQAVLVAVSGLIVAVTHLAESLEAAARHKAAASGGAADKVTAALANLKG